MHKQYVPRASKVMSQKDYELFTVLAQSSQYRLQQVLYKLLKKYYKQVIHSPSYLMARGDIPVALVAHMDTVFTYLPENIYFDREKEVLWSPEGLGADDRAGVFLILKILELSDKNHKPTIIFTTDEERGGIGSFALVADFPQTPWPLKYIIQLDRRGERDCVFYENANSEFEKYVNAFGFETAWGTFSDISIICPTWGISGVNLSVGYEDEHFETETLHIKYTYFTLNKVLVMLNDIDNIGFFKYVKSPAKIRLGLYPIENDDDFDEDYYPFSSNSTSEKVCCQCKMLTPSSLMVPIKTNNMTRYVCGTCANRYVAWCDNCGQPFLVAEGHICPNGGNNDSNNTTT